MERRLYTVAEFCRVTSLCRATAYRLIRAGEVESVKIGRSRRILAMSVDTWLDRARSTSDERDAT